jgi:hypothetical protein
LLLSTVGRTTGSASLTFLAAPTPTPTINRSTVGKPKEATKSILPMLSSPPPRSRAEVGALV